MMQSTNNMSSNNRGGDIFDSMFERQYHWKNFYKNFIQQQQLENIDKHQETYLKKEMSKQNNLNRVVDTGIYDRNSEDFQKWLKTSEQKSKVIRGVSSSI